MNNKINSVLVSEDNRLSFLPKYFNQYMLSAEQGIFNTLKRFCKSYTGAYWNFYELSNGGFYMAPVLEEKLPLFVPSNGYEGIVSPDAAGIIATLYIINYLANLTESETLIDQYYLLRDFAAEHDEASEIYAAID